MSAINASAVTSPIQNKLDHHDIFALLLPGLFAIMLLYINLPETCHTDFHEKLKNMETMEVVALSVGAIVVAYGVGDLLQIFGKFTEKLLWWFHGGDPYFWLIPYGSESTDSIKKHIVALCRNANFLPESTKVSLSDTLKADYATALKNGKKPEDVELTRDLLDCYFARIKGISYTSSSFKDSCVHMISKAHMYRGYSSILGIFVPFMFGKFIYALCLASGDAMRTSFFILIGAGLLSLFVIGRFRHYTIKFNRYMYEGYLHALSGGEINKIFRIAEEYETTHTSTPRTTTTSTVAPATPAPKTPATAAPAAAPKNPGSLSQSGGGNGGASQEAPADSNGNKPEQGNLSDTPVSGNGCEEPPTPPAEGGTTVPPLEEPPEE